MKRDKMIQVIRTMGLGLTVKEMLTQDFENKILRNFRSLTRMVGLTEVEGLKLILDIFGSGDFEKAIKETEEPQEINMKMVKKEVQQLAKEVRTKYNIEPVKLKAMCVKNAMAHNSFYVVTKDIKCHDIIIGEFSKIGDFIEVKQIDRDKPSTKRYIFKVNKRA